MSYHCTIDKSNSNKEKRLKCFKNYFRRLKVAEAGAYHFFCHAINITSA